MLDRCAGALRWSAVLERCVGALCWSAVLCAFLERCDGERCCSTEDAPRTPHAFFYLAFLFFLRLSVPHWRTSRVTAHVARPLALEMVGELIIRPFEQRT